MLFWDRGTAAKHCLIKKLKLQVFLKNAFMASPSLTIKFEF